MTDFCLFGRLIRLIFIRENYLARIYVPYASVGEILSSFHLMCYNICDNRKSESLICLVGWPVPRMNDISQPHYMPAVDQVLIPCFLFLAEAAATQHILRWTIGLFLYRYLYVRFFSCGPSSFQSQCLIPIR